MPYSQLGAFVFTCAQSPSLEPLCLPVHNLPDCKFDGFIMPKYSHRNWEPYQYHTHFQMLLICNTSVLIAEYLSQVCACRCCSCCLPAKDGVWVVLVNWPQFLFFYFLFLTNERIPFKILKGW